MKYRKKPIVVEAVQLNERCLIEEDWFWDAVTSNEIIVHDNGKWNKNPAWCEIKTLEGGHGRKNRRLYHQRCARGALSVQA